MQKAAFYFCDVGGIREAILLKGYWDVGCSANFFLPTQTLLSLLLRKWVFSMLPFSNKKCFYI